MNYLLNSIPNTLFYYNEFYWIDCCNLDIYFYNKSKHPENLHETQGHIQY